MLTLRRLLPLSALLFGCTASAPSVREQDDLDRFVLAQLARRNVPGLSLAVVQDGRIVEARAYGVREAGGRDPVTPATLFQAGSISKAVAAATASGHLGDRRVVKGRWHLYPEMVAAGLWTTPTDLARFAIEIQRSLAGRSSNVISAATTRQMLTRQKADGGLGLFLQGSGPTLLFKHNGRDEGFDASMNAFAESGQGLVVMINANDNSRMINRIVGFVARRYGWPNASTFVAPVAGASLSEEQLLAYAGRYEITNNTVLTLVPSGGRLYSMSDGYPDEEFIPLGNDRFASADRPVSFSVTKGENGDVVGMTWTGQRPMHD